MRDLGLRSVVEAARRGDHAAWAELVARFQDFAFAAAVGNNGDWDAAADIAQDAFGIAFRKLADLEDPDAFPGWFAAVVRTACSRRHRVARPAPADLGALDVADPRQRDPALVVVDAMQVYRGMDIGTAKPTAGDRAAVRHHLLDLVDPADDFTVTQFVDAARTALGDIAEREVTPLLVAGTVRS